MHFNTQFQSYFILYIFFLFTISVHSIKFFNVWNLCVDVSVDENIFPVSLIQSSAYYQVCPAGEQHWRRFGSSQFKLHILRTTEPFVDKYIYIHHNGYAHFHNETRLTLAKWYGAQHEDL